MIAERPTKTRAAENTEEDLFEGLSFPEVPTAPIAPSAYMQPTVTQKPSEVLQRPESRPSQVDVEPSKVVAPAVMEAPKKPTNLSALYATEVVTSDSGNLYPDLPSFADHHEEEAQGLTNSYTYNSYSAEQNDESASLLPRQSTAAVPIVARTSITSAGITSRPVSQSVHSPQTDSGHPELITELVTENSRLAEEVANLRRMIEGQSMNTTTSQGMHGGQTFQPHLQRQQQEYQRLMMPQSANMSASASSSTMAGMAQQTANNTITGVQITDTSRPPEKGVKYVCCGGCRQWLMAPRDAVYVVCAQCDSINNCNLAPKDSTEAHNREAETRLLTQGNNGNENMFWFLDCFSRGLF